MADIVKLPMLNKMKQLCCDECESTTLNLFFSEEEFLRSLAFKCVSCGYIGYFTVEDEVA
jgi:RNase P subunit RPR2